jgi:hypothetical protein
MIIEIKRINPSNYPVTEYGVFLDDVCIADSYNKREMQNLAAEMKQKPKMAAEIRGWFVKWEDEKNAGMK